MNNGHRTSATPSRQRCWWPARATAIKPYRPAVLTSMAFRSTFVAVTWAISFSVHAQAVDSGEHTDDLRSGIQLAQATLGASPSSASTGDTEPSNAQRSPEPGVLEEVLVTAQKRTESLLDVPLPVTVISADVLSQNNQPRLQDYFTSVPGLSVSPSPGAGGQQTISIRGISTGAFTTPTVGVTVDDVPYGSSVGLGSVLPDIDPSDLARIEVLRGPQGTLYGASSMGGLIKFVTVDPSTDALSGRIEAGTSSVHNGAELGYAFRGAINVPITDTLAVRASGFTRDTPGYIDNPVLGIKGINEEHVSGGRVAALWRPSDMFSLKLSALYQEDKGDGASQVTNSNVAGSGYVGPALGDLQQNYIRNTGQYEQRTQAYSATLTGKVGNVDLTSISGYNIINFSNVVDDTYGLGTYSQQFYGVSGAPLFTGGSTNKFTQEMRASIPLGERFEWLIGGFYTNEHSPFIQNVWAENVATGATVGDLLQTVAPSGYTYSEYAGFTDLTVHVTDQFDVQLGGRESQITVNAIGGSQTGALDGNVVTPTPNYSSKATPFTYLVTPRFKVSPDFMVYLRLASGYAAGGPNEIPGQGQVGYDPKEPLAYQPEKTRNYEIGIKGDALDHTLSFDASLYYIDFQDLQINLIDAVNGEGYTTNGSGAKSEGVELSVQSKPLEGLTVTAWGTYDNAVLTQSIPADSSVYGPAGSRLPYSTRFSGNLSFNQEFLIVNGVTGYAGGTLAYVGNRIGTFVATPDQQYYPAFVKTDLRTGIKYESWTVNLYANNVADKRGLVGGGAGTYPPFAFVVIQPRTVGLSLTRTF